MEEATEKKQSKPEWVKMKPVEVEKLIVDLGKKGTTPEKIGLMLRDEHGIPKAKLLGKKIAQILKENKVPIKSDSERVTERVKNLEGHIVANKHDMNAKKALEKQLWVLRKANQKLI